MNFFRKLFSCQQNLEEFKILFDISPAVIIRVDEKGYVTYANKTFEEIFGYPLNEFLNRIHARELYKDGIKEAKKVYILLKSKDYGGIGKLKDYETVGITRYGEEIPFLMHASLIYKNGKEVGSIGYLFDISERKKIEREIEKQKERFKNLLDNASIGMYIRKDHEFKYFNKKFQELLGYTEKELRRLSYTQIIDESCFESCRIIYEKILNGENVKLPYESIFKRKDGKRLYVELFVNVIDYDGEKAVQGFVNDITEKKKLENELREANKKLKELAIKDDLTGVYNIRYFREMLKLKYLESKRYNTKLSLIIVDIDDFKNINDTYGHLAGDYILKNVAKILTNSVRNIDIVARYGGDEFIVILPSAGKDEAFKVAKRILNNIQTFDFWYELNKINVAISIGISSFDEKIIRNENDLLRCADEALYKVKKREGKCDIEIFDEK